MLRTSPEIATRTKIGAPAAPRRARMLVRGVGLGCALALGAVSSASAAFSSAASTVPVGGSPIAVAVGDLSGDGAVDFAALNQTEQSVTLEINDGSGHFTASTVGPTGPNPLALALGDLNGDGRTDIVVANGDTNSITVFTKDAAGPDYTPSTFAVGAVPAGVAVGDLDGDHRADIAVTNAGDATMTLLTNNGNGGFAASSLATGANPTAVAIADLDGDGDADLAVSNGSAKTVRLYFRDPSGGTYTTQNVTTGTRPSSVAIGDLNGDGRPDVVTANATTNNLSLLVKDAAGPGYTATTLATGSTPKSVAIGDLDGDGRPDLVAANSLGSSVSVFLKDATGSTYTSSTLPAEPGSVSVALAPLAGTGRLDIVTANSLRGTASLFRNTTVLAPSVVTGASAVSDTGASIAGTVDPNLGATNYTFEYGTTTSFGAITPITGAGAGDSPAPASATITGLTPNTTYYYRLVGSNPAGTTAGVVRSFRTTGAGQVPIAVTQPATGTSTSASTLHGQVNPRGAPTAFTFEYGTSTSFGSITTVTQLDDADALEPVAATLSGLAPDTTYYYRVVASNAFGTATGPVMRFSTGPGGAPNASTGLATAVTGTSATLAGTVDAHGSQTAFAFEYGPTTSFGSLSAIDNAGDSNALQSITLPITGLTPNTTYRYRIVATNANGTTTGIVRSFTTGAGV